MLTTTGSTNLWSASTTGDSSLVSNFVAASTCNYSNNSRGSSTIDMVVVHTSEGSYTGTYNWFQDCDAAASAHYVIRASDGEITQMVDETMRAWHAGVSSWHGEIDVNSLSIGIEIQNPGHGLGYEPFPMKQMEAVAALSIDIFYMGYN